MKNTSLSHGKKSTVNTKDSLVKNNGSFKRSDDLSKTGLEFHKPFAHNTSEKNK